MKTNIALFEPAALTDTAAGDPISLAAFHGLAEFILTASATGDAGQTAVVTIEHSDKDDAEFEAVAEYEAVDDTGASIQTITLNTNQLKKYVRAAVTLEGDTPTVTCAVVVSGNRNYA